MRGQVQTQIAWPKPGRVIIGIIAINVIVYVLQLLLLRANQGWVLDLYLSPRGVFDELHLWQPLTYMVLHDPKEPWHLLFNMLWVYFFGTQLERWWGERRFGFAYVIFGLGGAALTLLIGLLSTTSLLSQLLPSFWLGRHFGASAATMGIITSWGLVYANEEMNFLLLGRMKGKTFVLIVLAFELLRALSFSPVSSTSHFGGMLAALILCRGLWRPEKVKGMLRSAKLKRQRKRVEAELRVLEGGRGAEPDKKKPSGPDPSDPKNWN